MRHADTWEWDGERGVKVEFHTFLISEPDGVEKLSLQPRGNSRRYHLSARLVQPHGLSGRFGAWQLYDYLCIISRNETTVIKKDSLNNHKLELMFYT